MLKHFALIAAAAAAPALFTGCATSNAHYVETGGRENIVTVGQINIQDFSAAAESAINSLLASGALDKVQNPPAVVAISRVVNNTGQHIDTDLLTKKIRIAMLQSGKALTSTTEGLGGVAEDPLAKGLKQEADFLADKKVTRSPDFSLSGKIIETRARAENLRQSTYSFQLSLTDNRGLAVWEGEKEITKQGSRPSVGF
jgi:uncharacterized protein (TIGR02722 family)